jgi:Glutamyl-tRNAGlu reductase, dimerisation domain
MSPIGHALHSRFEEVCRHELDRLRRKTAALSPRDRAEVDAISVEVTRAIATRMEAALAAGGTDVAEVVARLFAVR